MSSYTKATNFATKDTLPTGDSNKIVKGTEIDNEFNAISGAISSKADIASPTFTGTPAAPTATTGSNTTQLANTAYVKQEITALSLGNMSTQAKSAVDITGGTIVGITDLAVADGGTGASTLTSKAVLIGKSGIDSAAFDLGGGKPMPANKIKDLIDKTEAVVSKGKKMDSSELDQAKSRRLSELYNEFKTDKANRIKFPDNGNEYETGFYRFAMSRLK